MQLLEEYFEELFDPKDILQNWRKKAWDRFQEMGWPDSTKEAFRYLHLKDILLPKPAEKPECVVGKLGELLFIDGYFQGASLPSPVVCLPLDEAMRTYGIFLQNRWMRTLKEETDPFAALNGALQGSGAFLYIPPHCHVEHPIEVSHKINGSKTASPRLHVYLNKGSSLTLLQKTTAHGDCFFNGLIDVVLDEGASLHFQEMQHLSNDTHSFQTFRATLKRDSRMQTLSFSKGSQISRNSMKLQLLEENSEVEIQGLTELEGSLQHHTHVTVEHVAPHCKSRQHFKTVLKGNSRSSFEGKILVRSAAQKTESYQLNNNLLLSDEAIVYSKPNLEIFADDVKASHGATITQLDAEEIFYLRSRGLKPEDAEKWLIDGFSRPLIDQAHPSFKDEFLHA